ncbi:ribosomal protein L6 [Thermodesulfobium narugense DSM 14796]|uniref:Large ribosomal subunit protein uL6 n=1 Tax=Thermodesulfobium narugense DSM 14796 TaxID=747365 RepID=M1E7V4_9BACT|nr:50S ribosomal protein L6 [Thermodesulfobium narugense]AEE14159.1 ribosomal protein L6 [Thermodesulfobium narugense DSM 14796]
MSRIGKKPIAIPKGVNVELDTNLIKIKGPLGELSQNLPPEIDVKIVDNKIEVERKSDSKRARAFHGLFRTLIANMVTGVSEGFKKGLELVGTGYRAQLQGNKLVMQLRHSHPVEFVPPQEIKFELEGNNKIWVKGISKELVGQIAANVRKSLPPDSYKGKGIRYIGEVLHLKPGKAGTKK